MQALRLARNVQLTRTIARSTGNAFVFGRSAVTNPKAEELYKVHRRSQYNTREAKHVQQT
jgi:hypothetical protein